MKASGFIRFLTINLCAVCFASTSLADEPGEDFLQALRDRGYHDIALDYLQEMESSPLASAKFKQTLPFEKAQTLIHSTSQLRDISAIEQRLEQAEKLLVKSEAAVDSQELRARAQNYQGDLLFRRANLYLTQAENERLTAGEKQTQQKQAQDYLKKALDAFGRARGSYKEIIDNFQVDLRDPESKQTLKKLRETFTVVRMKLPQIIERNADTLDENNAERKQNLTTAATEFEKLWSAYPKFHAGIYSCYFAARCNYKMGNYPAALNLAQELLALGNNTSLQQIKRQALALSADCWSKTDPYPFDEVIANLETISSRLTRRDLRQSDWQRIQLELARAYHAKATELQFRDPSDGRIKNLFRDASKLIKAIARLPGDHRSTARNLMAKWNLNVAETSENERVAAKPIRTFSDGKQQGLELITEIEGYFADIADIKRMLNAKGADTGKLQSQLEATEEQLADRSKQCLAVFERALQLATSETTREDLNQIRYLQSICYFVNQNFFESALIGEFLVDRYPTISFSKQAGAIAVRSYAALHDKSSPDDRSFERERLTKLANKVVESWPGSSESTEAASTLTKLLLAQPELTEAEIATASSLIDTVPEDSPSRGVLDVKLGTKLWFIYRRKQAERREDMDQLAVRLDLATEYLNDGTQRFTRDNLVLDAAWGALFLVSAHLESGNLKSAIEQLETAAVAPVDLVKLKHPAIFQSVKRDLFVSETYKTAGKAYLAALGDKSLPGNWADKALGVVRAMQSRADKSGDPNAVKDVNNMYRLIAIELEKQLRTLDSPAEQQAFVQKLGKFLSTLQKESNDPNTIIWAGKTYMSLGDMFDSETDDKQAKSLYASAVSALDRASKIGVSDPKLVYELKRQQALAKRGAGKYEAAFEDLKELLSQSPNSWKLQVDAAATLQRWGMQTKTPKPLAKALSGTEPRKDPKTGRQRNLVWGWSALANALKSKPELMDAHYKSLFGAVTTRFEYGVMEKNVKVVKAALRRLEIAKAKNPGLESPDWKPKFDELEQRIKKQLDAMNSGATGGQR